MKFPAIRWRRVYHSIIIRVILLSVLGVIVANSTRAYYSLRLLKTDTAASTAAQQQSFAQDLAADIAHKLALRQSVLQALAQALPVALLDKPEALRDWLALQQGVLAPLFEVLLVERGDGVVMAAHPPQHMPFQPMQGAAAPSPQIGIVGQVPSVALTSALAPPSGQSGWVLRGLNALAVPGLLDAVQTHKNGHSGGSLVLFPKEHLYLDLSAPKPRLQPIPETSASALFALNGADAKSSGPLPTPVLDTHGQEVFARESPVASTTWRVVVSMPTAEAYLPVTSKTRHYLDSVPFVVPLLLLYSTIVAYFILRPLGRAALLADQMSRGETPLVRLPVARPDEIGALTAAFNRLLDRLDAQSKELGEQKELAESAATAKSRFLAAASHDLRQPMHALNLYLGALDQFELPATARPVMASARECAQTMDEMFRALLDISKLDASTLQADLRTFAIAPLLEKIKNGFVQQAQAKGLELRVAPCSAFVASDPELLERVLSNLVSNAVRYTTHGKILLGCRRTAGGLRVGVYDTGPGIAADQQQAVFEEFYQVGNPERQRAQGLGLGLAIVQRLSALLRAPLVLHSVPGRGSVFSIEVPRAHPYPQALVATTATNAVTSAPGRAALAPKGALQGALIVVVDDEALILDATALLLRQWGCTVITAASGAEAIERLSQCARVPDAIVCDHRLRGSETGVDVIAALRSEFNCDIPAMLITGDTSPERMQSILITGIPVLNKPLQDHVLQEALLGLVNPKLLMA